MKTTRRGNTSSKISRLQAKKANGMPVALNNCTDFTVSKTKAHNTVASNFLLTK